MPVRQSFTQSDDEHLVEYIAKNNPGVSGRNGNKLYEALVDNPKRWPWSRSHPWRSWRERYKKNPELFDRKISRYLKRQRGVQRPPIRPSDQVEDIDSQTEESSAEEEETPKERIREDDYMHELFGSSTEDEDAEPEDPPVLSAPTSPAIKKIYPDLRNVPPPSISEKEPHRQDTLTKSVKPSQDPTPRNSQKNRLPGSQALPPTPVRHPLRPSQGDKRLSKRKALDEEDPFYFNSPPPSSPSPEQRPAIRKAPPTLKEGPFRNRYVQPQNAVENESAAVWPPTRKRPENERPSQPTKAPAPAPIAIIGQKPRQQVNAVASSSKVKLPVSTALRPDDPLLTGTALKKQQQQPTVSLPKGGEPTVTTMSKPPSATTAVPNDRTKIVERGQAVRTEQPPAKRQKVAHLAQTDSTLVTVPTSSSITRISNHSHRNARTKNDRPTIRHIDLRESFRKRRQSAGLLSSRSSTSTSTASLLNSISKQVHHRDSVASTASRHHRQSLSNDDDVEVMALFERDLAALGEQYGFALGVVKQTYLQFGTLQKTVLVLRTLNAYMKGAQDKVYEDMQRLFDRKDPDTDDGESIPEGVIPKLPSSETKGKETAEEESHTTPSNTRPRRSLNYKPLTTDIEDRSGYSPPSKTRAGRYTKLQKEGREEEAVVAASGGSRPRKASGRLNVHLSNENRDSGRRDVQHQVTTIKSGIEPSSPLDMGPESSPPPKSLGLQEADVEEEEYQDEEGDDDGESAVEHDRMDVSPDRYEVHEPTPDDDDEQLELKAEHKKLCSEVTLANQTLLRAFEERQDMRLMKEQSREWIMERFAALEEAHEARRQEYLRIEAEKAKISEEEDDDEGEQEGMLS